MLQLTSTLPLIIVVAIDATVASTLNNVTPLISVEAVASRLQTSNEIKLVLSDVFAPPAEISAPAYNVLSDTG